jgi:hypothetical protein
MYPDPSFSPQPLPKARRCASCQAPLPGAGEITDAPRPPVGDFSLPRVPEEGAPSPLPRYVSAMLVALCVLFGLATHGFGLVALPVLLPTFVRLHRAAAEPNEPFRLPPSGFTAWTQAFGVTLLILFMASVAFLAVLVPLFCPLGLALWKFESKGGDSMDYAVIGLLFLLDLGAASAAAYLTARRWFPPGEHR